AFPLLINRQSDNTIRDSLISKGLEAENSNGICYVSLPRESPLHSRGTSPQVTRWADKEHHLERILGFIDAATLLRDSLMDLVGRIAHKGSTGSTMFCSIDAAKRNRTLLHFPESDSMIWTWPSSGRPSSQSANEPRDTEARHQIARVLRGSSNQG